MVSTTVELRNVEGTQAAMGWADGHTGRREAFGREYR
jgi:hypothetical protein